MTKQKQERVAQQLLAECDRLQRLARCQSGMPPNEYEEEESWASGGATAINPTSCAAPSGYAWQQEHRRSSNT
jgi:hypothetical protein